MTNDSKKYTPDGELVEDFIDREQAALIRYLETSYGQKKITETYYKFALDQHCDSDDWDGASEYFIDVLTEFVNQCQRYDYYLLLERIDKGERYLATADTNDSNYTKWVKGYEQLCRQLRNYTANQQIDGQRAG